MAYLYVLLFMLTIPLANWMIGNVGTECVSNGPCLIPVGFGYVAPSGVLMVALALVLRDLVHERMGIVGALLAVAIGAVLSFVLGDPHVALASAAAFLFAETCDLMVYAPLRERSKPAAVFASGVVGAFVDSAIFIYLAFGSLDFVIGNTIGKLYASFAVALFLILRSRCFLGHAWSTDFPHPHVYVDTCDRCGKRKSGWTFY